MDEKNFVALGNWGVLIPYSDLEKLVNMAQNAEKTLDYVKKIEKRCSAMQLQYLQVLEKVRELEKMI